MRRIAAHYLFLRGEVISRPVVTIDDRGCICAVEQWQRLDTLPCTEFYAGALAAGMVNAHCHLELSYLRGAIERGTGFGGFARAIGAVRGNYTTEQRRQAIAAADARMWAEGVQAVGDVINDDSSIECKGRSPIHYHNFVELFGLNTSAEAMDHLLATPHSSLTPHSTYSLQSAPFAAAAKADMLSVHFMESPDEEALFRGEGSLAAWYERMGWRCDFLHYGSPTERLIAEVGRDRRVLLIHGCCLTEGDVKRILSHFLTPPTFVLCPQSNAYISGLRPPVETLLRYGAQIAIGTDSLASNDNLSLIEELKLLPDIALATRIEWATMGGAKALGLEQEMGSIEVGKRPGIVLIEGVEMQGDELQLLPSARSRRIA